jgi:hypothetical protein
MGGPETLQRMILIETLTVAVPLWIERIRDLGDTAARDSLVREYAADAVDAVASRGDVLQFGGARGEAAAVFNATARGLAALACCPGGVTFLGVAWCVAHSPLGRAAESWEAVCRHCVSGAAPIEHGPDEAEARRAIRRVETTIPRGDVL